MNNINTNDEKNIYKAKKSQNAPIQNNKEFCVIYKKEKTITTIDSLWFYLRLNFINYVCFDDYFIKKSKGILNTFRGFHLGCDSRWLVMAVAGW